VWLPAYFPTSFCCPAAPQLTTTGQALPAEVLRWWAPAPASFCCSCLPLFNLLLSCCAALHQQVRLCQQRCCTSRCCPQQATAALACNCTADCLLFDFLHICPVASPSKHHQHRSGSVSRGAALVGPTPSKPVQFQEHGLSFAVNLVAGQKTGFFLDQRDNRHWMQVGG
jgi:hypothetical protein